MSGSPDLLRRWVDSARASLRDRGSLTLIWRAEGLADVLQALEAGYGTVSVLPVHPAPDRPAIRVIASAEKGGAATVRMLPPLILNDETLRPSPRGRSGFAAGPSLADLRAVTIYPRRSGLAGRGNPDM